MMQFFKICSLWKRFSSLTLKNHRKNFVSNTLFHGTHTDYFKFKMFALNLSFPVPHWAGDNTDLLSDSNISKAVIVNIAFTRTFFKEYSVSLLMLWRLTDFALVVLKLLMFKVCGIIGMSKIEFFNFSGTDMVN